MNKKAVLLDAGGVILDETVMEEAFCQFTVNILRPYVKEYSAKDYWLDIEESVLRFAPRTRPYIFWKYLKNDYDNYCTVLNEFHIVSQNCTSNLTLMKGIDDELRALAKRFALVLAGQYGENVYGLLKDYNLDGLFINRLSQDDFTITKPDPRYIKSIAELSGFQPAECIMIGDRIDNDVVPAVQNNMGTVFVKTGIYKNQVPRDANEVPDIICDTIKEQAEKILNKWG